MGSKSAKISGNNKGFTMLEMTIVVIVFALLFASGALAFSRFMYDQALANDEERLVQAIREAHVKAISQYGNSEWGVYFDDISDPNGFTVFKGQSYATRDIAYDQKNIFHKKVTYSTINLNGGGNEVIFGKRNGHTAEFGAIRIISDDNYFDTNINFLGTVDHTF